MGPEGRMEHVGRKARVCLPSLDEGLRPAVQTRGEQTLWDEQTRPVLGHLCRSSKGG